MQIYSPYFQTLYDQQEPVGTFGRGTHYSILRAVVFKPLAKHHDFAIIWDEDHDDRIIEVIESLYFTGDLANFTVFGERKGVLTAVARHASKNFHLWKIEEACRDLEGDCWGSSVSNYSSACSLIAEEEKKIQLFLENIDMLWNLGTKVIKT